MSEEQKNKQSSLKKTIFGLVAIFALILGVWFGIAGVEERQAEQALQAAKEAAEANVTGSGESNQQAGDDVAFMLAMKLNDLNGESQTVERKCQFLMLFIKSIKIKDLVSWV